MNKATSSTLWFPGAQNLSFVNGNFTTTIHGDSHVHSSSGFALLSQHVSHEAMFDSAARYPAGKCHPGTRNEVIQTILSWINDPSPTQPILWLHGLAGVGKSSIAQTISEILSKEHEERYGGSFFFRNGIAGRQESEKMFPTLAYQIGLNVLGVRDVLEEVMNQNHSLPTKTMDIQMQSLVVVPLQRASSVEPVSLHHTPTIVIDGLDECQDSDSQCRILSLIAESIHNDRVPLRFLISSRPEYWIREAFEQPMLTSLAMQISLDAPHLDPYYDIKRYLEDGFDNIYKKKARYMINVERPWPPPDVIQTFAYHASGQFIYASTVLKFVEGSSNYCDPRKQLDIITNPGPLHATAFTDLDNLYIRILSTFPQLNVLKPVLGSLLIRANPYAIQKFLGLDSGEISLALDSLSSLTMTYKDNYRPEYEDLGQIYAPTELISHFVFAHQSFEDFLADATRSGIFSIDTNAFREKVASVFFLSLKARLNNEVDFEENYDSTYRDIYFVIRHVSTLQAAITDLQPQIHHFLSNTFQSIQHATTLLRFLQCVQDLLRDSAVSKHTICLAIQALLKQCYTKIVQDMVSCGVLAISDMLIYMIGTTHIRLNFIIDMPGNSLSRTKAFLCQEKGIISFQLFQYPHPVAEEIYFSSFKLLDSIQSVLNDSGEEYYYAAYRARSIRVCFKSLKFLFISTTFSDHLRDRTSSLFDSHGLSGIQNDHDIYIPDFLPLIAAILKHDWELSNYCDMEQLAISTALWCNRQSTRLDIMYSLERHDADLAEQIRKFPEYIYEMFVLPQIALLPPHSREAWVLDRHSHGLSLKVAPPSKEGLGHVYKEEEVIFTTEPWVTTLDIPFRDVMEAIPDDCRTQYATEVVRIGLNSVAKDLYRLLNPGSMTSGVSDWIFQERGFSYLSRVQPIPAILKALRVVCYLGHKIIASRQTSESDSMQSLPNFTSDFGEFSICLLEKYNESDISRCEMDWFKRCLESWNQVERLHFGAWLTKPIRSRTKRIRTENREKGKSF